MRGLEGSLRARFQVKVLAVQGERVLLGGPDVEGAQWVSIGQSLGITLDLSVAPSRVVSDVQDVTDQAVILGRGAPQLPESGHRGRRWLPGR